MTIEEIKNYWESCDEELGMYISSQLINQKLHSETNDFLQNCGLPVDCPPMLNFDMNDRSSILTPNEIFKIDFEGLDDYLMIGSNNSGDPICIDLNNQNEIVYLNHDNYFERVYINQSAKQLAECLVLYKKFFDSLNSPFESNTITRRKFSDEEFTAVCNSFIAVDSCSLSDNGLWKSELDFLVWERDNE